MIAPAPLMKWSASSSTIGHHENSWLDPCVTALAFMLAYKEGCALKMPRPYNTCTRHGTHIGHIRRTNEDALFVNEREGLWLVADGIGGHGNGEKASAILVGHVEGYRQSNSIERCVADIEARLTLANEACRNIPGSGISGTTVAALMIWQSKAIFLWAGDSRVYRLRGAELTLVTEDHNLAQERHRRGELSQHAAQRLPSANVLTRAIGINQHLRLERRLQRSHLATGTLLAQTDCTRNSRWNRLTNVERPIRRSDPSSTD